MPRGITAQEITSSIKTPGAGDILTTPVLDAVTTIAILRVANPRQPISFQRSGDSDLECTVDFSINGVDFDSSLQEVVADESITTMSGHLVAYIKVTRTDGSGKLIVVV